MGTMWAAQYHEPTYRPSKYRWHTSVVAGVATGTVAGFGLQSYELALRAIAARLAPGGADR